MQSRGFCVPPLTFCRPINAYRIALRWKSISNTHTWAAATKETAADAFVAHKAHCSHRAVQQ